MPNPLLQVKAVNPVKQIAFIATREPEYSRVSIIRKELPRYFRVDEFLSSQSRYPLRLIAIACRLLWAWATGRLKKNDAVFVGFFAQPIFPLVRLLYRGPIIADAYFSIYDTMVHDKCKAKEGSLIARLCFWLDQHMLRHARLCFTDTNQHVDYLRKTFDTADADIRRLWISADNRGLGTRPPAPIAGEPFEVLFWGGFIPLQGADTIVRAAAQLKAENVHFTIIGSGQTLARCLELRQNLDADNVNFAGWKRPRYIAEKARQAHLALGIFGTTAKAGRVIPNKAYEAMAMGIPLITRTSAAADELLQDGVDCLLVKPGDPEELASRILWARDHYDELLEIGQRGQQLFDRSCSPAEVGNILHHDVNSVLSPRVDPEPQTTTTEPQTTTAGVPSV